MAKIKHLYSRSAILIVGALLVLAVGLVAVTHADEKGERGERGERPEHEGRGALVNIAARLNLLPEFRLAVNNDNNVNVRGASVTATSTSGFTATTVTPPLTFIVQTDASTKFNIKGFGKGSIADVVVGDAVNFRGVALSGTTTSTWTVKALSVEGKTAHPRSPKSPKPFATTTSHINSTTTAQLQIDALTKVIARLQEVIAQLKIRFGL